MSVRVMDQSLDEDFIAGTTPPLKAVAARGVLEGLLFELTVEQTYRNDSRHNIEAEFTFPVPVGAVLLGLDLRIGDRALEAVAVRRAGARQRYESAVEQGDSAALLENVGEGLWHLSLGNLLAGEEARIRYRYAQLLDRHGDQVRLAVPTVIAPRYGNPAAGGLAPHQVPGTDLAADYPFSLEVEVRGAMAGALIKSPSHKIQVTGGHGERRVTLKKSARLDRDFILSLSGPVTRSASLVVADPVPASTEAAGEGARPHVALISLDPALTRSAPAPLALKLVVDCSGSMTGDSIGCARRALLSALDRLEPRDRVSLTRFGSTVVTETRGLIPASPANLDHLRRLLRGMEADLGGTELQAALSHAVAIPASDAPVKDILLITDGEIWSVPEMLAAAARSGHRLFVVAVGAAPAEALARGLGEQTGGACEFVGPNEDAAAAILRMFNRLREAPRRITAVRWPVAPAWEAPYPEAVFSGDTLHLAAGFATRPEGEVVVTVSGADGEDHESRVSLAPSAAAAAEGASADAVADAAADTKADRVARVAVARHLRGLPVEEGAALAERYQLASPWTSFVVVKARAEGEKAHDLPRLAQVHHMLAAGWGGTGSIRDVELVRRVCLAKPSVDLALSLHDSSGREFLRKTPGSVRRLPIPAPAKASPAEVLIGLASGARIPTSALLLSALGVPAALCEWLADLADARDVPESEVIALFIALLTDSTAGAGLADEARARLQGALLGDRELRELRRLLREKLAAVTAERWGEWHED